MTQHIRYYPAKLVRGVRTYVQYSVRNAATGKMERYRHYYDKVKGKHGLAQARAFIEEINDKLARGWFPGQDAAAPLLGAPLREMTDLFLEVKARELRPRSLPNYKSRITRLHDWLAAQGHRTPSCNDMTPLLAIRFLDSLLADGMSGRTYNNYVIDMKSLSNWGVKRGYFSANPFDGIKPLRRGRPETRPLTDREVQTMMQQIREQQPQLLIVCGLVYYCALRPEEISHIRVRQVDAAHGMIRVTSDNTKDHDGNWITVPSQFMPDLLAYIDKATGSDYLVSKGFAPGPKRLLPVRHSEAWKKHREAAKLPEDVKLYGLKHTALQRFSHRTGVSLLQIRDHARHSSVAITDAYMQTLKGDIDRDVRSNYPDLLSL